MKNIITCVLIVIILIVIFLVLLNKYNSNIPRPNSTAINIDVIKKYNNRIKEFNNIKELFGNVAEPLNLDELDKILKDLGITNNQLNNLSLSIDDYIDQISQNEKIKDNDKKRVLDLLSQIYAIKLNDSINSLNAVAVGEYLKMKTNNKYKFTPN